MSKRQPHRALAVAVALLGLLLASCGAAGGASNGGGATSGAGGHSTATTLPCDGAPATPSTAPGVTLRNNAAGQTTHVLVGAVVEIRLDGKHALRREDIKPTGALAPTGAQGAPEHGDCVWDFTVAQQGVATVSFVGGALCQPTQACPMYAILATFTIHAT